MSQMRDLTPSNRSAAVQHSHCVSLTRLVVTVGVTWFVALWPWEGHGARRTEDLLVSSLACLGAALGRNCHRRRSGRIRCD